jgi:hypothetical protein
MKRACGTPGARCTHGLVRSGSIERTRLATVSPGSTRRSARDGVNGLSRCSPAADTLFRRRRNQLRMCPLPGWGAALRRMLDATRGIGTTRLRRPHSVVASAFIGSHSAPAEHTALTRHPAPDAAASIASHPACRGDRDTPLSLGRDEGDYSLGRIVVNGADGIFSLQSAAVVPGRARREPGANPEPRYVLLNMPGFRVRSQLVPLPLRNDDFIA